MRWRLLAALVAVVAVAVPVWSWADGARKYDRLYFIMSDWSGAGVEVDDNIAVPDELRFRYGPRDTFMYGVGLINDGDRPVRITGFEDQSYLYLFSSAEVWTALMPMHQAVPPDHLDRFKPFTLPPHRTVWIEFRYSFVDCPGGPAAPSGSMAITERTMDFKVGPFSRSKRMQLPHALVIRDTPQPCPKPG